MTNAIDNVRTVIRGIQPIRFINSLNIIAFLLLLLILTSCHATIVKPQVDLHSNQLRFNSVALYINSKGLMVRNITEFETLFSEDLIAVSPLIGLIASGIEHASNKSKDAAVSDTYKENLTRDYIATYIGQSFLDQINKSKIFPISLSAENNRSQLVSEGYDALIVIKIEEISILKEFIAYPDKLSVHVKAKANMINLRSGINIWNRDEMLTSDEAYSFEEYRADNSALLIKVLNSLLDKLAFRLSSYIIYSE